MPHTIQNLHFLYMRYITAILLTLLLCSCNTDNNIPEFSYSTGETTLTVHYITKTRIDYDTVTAYVSVSDLYLQTPIDQSININKYGSFSLCWEQTGIVSAKIVSSLHPTIQLFTLPAEENEIWIDLDKAQSGKEFLSSNNQLNEINMAYSAVPSFVSYQEYPESIYINLDIDQFYDFIDLEFKNKQEKLAQLSESELSKRLHTELLRGYCLESLMDFGIYKRLASGKRCNADSLRNTCVKYICNAKWDKGLFPLTATTISKPRALFFNSDYRSAFLSKLSDQGLEYFTKFDYAQNHNPITSTETLPIDSLLAKYKGQKCCIILWGVSCGACEFELEELSTVRADYPDVKFIYITTPYWSKPKPYYEHKKKLPGDHYYVNETSWQNILNQYKAFGIPLTLFVSESGVVAKHVGCLRASGIREYINEL